MAASFSTRISSISFSMLLHVRRTGHRADARAGTRLVHHVDGLVRQEPAGDIAIGKFDGCCSSASSVSLALWCASYFGRKTLEDLDGLVDARRVHLDGLETALQGGVLLDVLAVLVERRRADALQFAAAERRLDDVTRVHRALGGTGTDDGVQFVDEQDDVARAADFVHHRLDALLELAAVLGAGDHQCEVERDDFFIAQQFGDVAARDFLRQTFRDGGLADTGLAEQHGIVLRAAAEHLDDAFDFVASADDGVEFAFFGQLGQVPAKRAQGGSFYVLLVAVFGGHFLFGLRRCEVGIEFLEDFVAGAFDVDFQAFENPGGDAFAFAQEAEQDVLGADVGMVEALGLFARQRENFLHARGVRDIADHLGLGAAADLFFDLHAHGLHVETHLLQHVDGNTLAKFDQAEEQVLGPDVIMIEAISLFTSQG